MMNATLTMPCVELPRIPEIPAISLLGGAELRSFVDLSAGAPTDCKLTFNLLLQLAPLLASMSCIFKILNAITALADGVQDPTKIPSIPGAIADLAKCIPVPGVEFYLMIKGILSLVVRFLSCFIDDLESMLKFQATIDLSAADGNPVLRDTLMCAQNNAQTGIDNMMLSLQPIEPILNVTTMLIGMTPLGIKLPDVSAIAASADTTEVVTSLRQAVDQLKQAVDSIPG
jgi:hypothetical protein